MVTSFRKKAYDVVKKIPKGKILTYKEVAEKVGRPKACRAVGNILNKSVGWRKGIPCHRVVRSDGNIGGYNRGKREKIKLLEQEGVNIIKGKIYLPPHHNKK
jgi:O-6-methylguanine DNA methyltransferase